MYAFMLIFGENLAPNGADTFAARKYDVHWAGNLFFIYFILSCAFLFLIKCIR